MSQVVVNSYRYSGITEYATETYTENDADDVTRRMYSTGYTANGIQIVDVTKIPNPITKFYFGVGKGGTPTGSINCGIFNTSGTEVESSADTYASSTISSSAPYTIKLFNFEDDITLANGFRIAVYGGGGTSAYIGIGAATFIDEPSPVRDNSIVKYISRFNDGTWSDYLTRNPAAKLVA